MPDRPMFDPATPHRAERRRPAPRQTAQSLGSSMLDITFIALGAGFFLACVAYTLVCDRL